MAVYRNIQITFWQDEFVLELTPEEKYFYIYLMTNSKTTQCGIYEITKKVICFETGHNDETVTKLIKRFEEYSKIKYDEKTKELLIFNWIKHNPINNINIQKCVEKELKAIKSKELIEKFESVNKGLISGLQTPTKKKEKEKEEEKEEEEEEEKEEEEEEKKIVGDFDTFFDSVWNLYPEKIGKNKIKTTHKKELYNLGFEKIRLCIERYIKNVEERRNNGFKTLNFQNGSTFFNGGYKDFLEEQKATITKNKSTILMNPDHL